MDPSLVLIDIEEFLEAGGPIVRVLLLVAIALWAMIFERFLFFRFELGKVLESTQQRWHEFAGRETWYAEKLKRRLVAETERRLRGPLPMIKAFVMMCPLLGLLGTVTGMIQVFDVMAVLGTGNAREMASGVSAATLPTLAGMVLALSGMYPASRFEHIVSRETRALRDHLTVKRGGYEP